MKGNQYHKLYWCDKFGWKFYTKRAARELRRYEKNRSKRFVRRHNKKICYEEMGENTQECNT